MEQTPLILSTVAKATLMRTRQKVQAMLVKVKKSVCAWCRWGLVQPLHYVSRKESRAQKLGFVSTTLIA